MEIGKGFFSSPEPAPVTGVSVRIARRVAIPDPMRLARFKRSPELGARVLFFSGGSSLRDFCSELISYTHNSIHLITPFDSGGSSAVLRKAFAMPAVGDMRNRLMALADRSLTGNPATYQLFAYRLPREGDPEAEFETMIDGSHPLIKAVSDPMRKLIRRHLVFFKDVATRGFDYRGASVGNLILAGGYFNYNRKLDPVLFLFSKLVEAKGRVRPIINKDLTLAARLRDGSLLLGQHLLTGKQAPKITSPVEKVYLSVSQDDPTPVVPSIRRKTAERIRTAEVICYPMGSFYSSLVATILPKGVGEAVAQADCPKIYIPNTAGDPEQFGLGLGESVEILLDYLLAGTTAKVSDVLQYILLDLRNGVYPEPHGLKKIRSLGIEILDVNLVTPRSAPFIDPVPALANLMSFAP